MKRILISILAVLMAAGSAIVQFDGFTEMLNLSEKKLNKLIVAKTHYSFDNLDITYGQGAAPDLSKVDMKKVALVTYNVGSTWTSEARIEEGGGFYIGGKFYNESIDALKESFASRGIELITYNDMSAEQIAIMNDKDGDSWLPDSDPSKLKKLKKRLSKSTEELSENTGKTGEAWAPMDKGTFNWHMDRMPYRIQMYSYVIDDLEVDAILLVSQYIDIDRTIVFIKSNISLIGPNPIPKVEGKKYPGLSHADGLLYNTVKLNTSPKQPVEIGTVKHKRWSKVSMKDLKLNLEGYADLTKLMMDKFWEEYDRMVQICVEAHEKQKNK